MSQGLGFALLGSGSRGNATLVTSGQTRLLIDCGFTLKATLEKLDRLQVDPASLTALLVTHEHGDHAAGIGPLARRYRLPVYSTAGTQLAAKWGDLPDWRLVQPGVAFSLGGLQVHPVTVPHDAREPVQFVLSDGIKRLGILTDLGSVTPHVLHQYQACDTLILEANHDRERLEYGPYPPSLKRRVAGDFGHLSNEQAATLLSQLDTSRLQRVVASHLSEQNNLPDLATRLLSQALNGTTAQVLLADQENGLDWHTV